MVNGDVFKVKSFAGVFLKESMNPRDQAMAGYYLTNRKDAKELKAGAVVDFFDKKNGDKLNGTIQKYDGKTITIKPSTGAAQKFNVRSTD